MDLLVIQFPRGVTAVAWCDPVTETVSTSHAALQATLQRGVKDLEGHLLFPRDGRRFLSALYDHVFLAGYAVRWLRAATIPGVSADL